MPQLEKEATPVVTIRKPAIKLQALSPKELGVHPSVVHLMQYHDNQVEELEIQIREHRAAKVALMRSEAVREGEDIALGLTISADNRVLYIAQRPVTVEN